MNQTTPMQNKNTYSLILQSEEKGRSIFETAVYGLLVLGVASASWQFAFTPVTVPGMNRASNTEAAVEMMAKAPVEQPIIASRS